MTRTLILALLLTVISASAAPAADVVVIGGTGNLPATAGGDFVIGPEYRIDPDLTDRGNPKGRSFEFTMALADSKIFRGDDATLDPKKPIRKERRIFVYVPAAYVDGTQAPVLVMHDGPGLFSQVCHALDNLTRSSDPLRRLPPFIVISVENGGGDSRGSQRGLEYDTMSDRLARFVNDEIFPAVLNRRDIRTAFPNLAITDDPWGRAVMGCSSGGAAALTMGWFRPDLFRRLITYSGTFVDHQDDDAPEKAKFPLGAWEYHSSMNLIGTTEKKPLRIFVHVAENDVRVNDPEETHFNFIMANKRTAAALASKGYDYRYVFSKQSKHCDKSVFEHTLADTLVWMWHGYGNERAVGASVQQDQRDRQANTPVPPAAEGSQLQWTAAAVSKREKAVQLFGRNGFAVIRNAAEEKIFLNRLERTGVKLEWAQHKRTAEWANFKQGMQVVCWRDIHTADTLKINGSEQVAGSGSGKRDTLRLGLEVTIGFAKANARAWKASCVWIPRVPRIEVPGPGKDEIWRADSAWGDVADGLQASLEVKQRQIQPGEDITLTMNLRNVRPAGGDPVNDPVRVWDNKYSEGYRADFYLVVAPDGQSRILRRAVQPEWDKNVPTPITIEPGKSWTLAGIANDAIVKSLKELGLDTSQEGIYTITAYYEANANPGPKPTGPIPFWSGQIATPPVEVRVGKGEFKAPAPDKIKATADAQTLYLRSPITVKEVATAAPAPELCVRSAKQQGQFDLELRMPGKGANPRMTVEAGKWGTLEVAGDTATQLKIRPQLKIRARVNAEKEAARVSCQVTVAVTGGFKQWIAEDEPWSTGEWKALREDETAVVANKPLDAAQAAVIAQAAIEKFLREKHPDKLRGLKLVRPVELVQPFNTPAYWQAVYDADSGRVGIGLTVQVDQKSGQPSVMVTRGGR